eukprot:scaffold14621_cov44-Phaeocystis_antarctica.AAC.1
MKRRPLPLHFLRQSLTIRSLLMVDRKCSSSMRSSTSSIGRLATTYPLACAPSSCSSCVMGRPELDTVVAYVCAGAAAGVGTVGVGALVLRSSGVLA